MEMLESYVDDLFENNAILKLPFLHVYSHFCEGVIRELFKPKGSIHEIVIPYTFVFEKLTDFSDQSMSSCTKACYLISPNDFKMLYACANLNIVLPFVHSGIYSFKRRSECESDINYADDSVLEFELNDALLTQMSLPQVLNIDRSPKDLHESVRTRLNTERSFQPIRYEEYISKMYERSGASFLEADLTSGEFYEHIGFTSINAFRKIRVALVCICQTYLDIARFVDLYLERNALYGTPTGRIVWEGLAMAKLSAQELERFVLELTCVDRSDYQKFCEFFFFDESAVKGISNKFMPPFWVIGDNVYFSPAVAPTTLGVRNLLISIQNDKEKNKKYKYDSMISRHFEPALLRRAIEIFDSASYSTVAEKNFDGGEIDLLVYCKKSNTVLSVQAKATLYPESARMVRRLDDRVVEAVNQILRFDGLENPKKIDFLMSVLPEIEDAESLTYINAVLTNSGIGSKRSWELLRQHQIIPLNPNLLKKALGRCGSLLDLAAQVDKCVQEFMKLANPSESIKTFDLPEQTIIQRHVEFENLNAVR